MPRKTKEIRSERTLPANKEFSLAPDAANELFKVFNTRGWEAMLDLMEACVLEEDTALINVDVADDAKVLAQHKMTKAAWVIFVKFQQRAQREIAKHVFKETDTDPKAAPPKRDCDL